MRKRCMVLGSILLLALMLPASSSALLIYGYGGESGLGFFEGSLIYAPLKETAVLTVQLTNTSPAAGEGYITGLAFNNPMGYITGISFSGAPFDLIGGPGFNNGINGMPLGYFDIGAALGGDWMGGGDPKPGIGVGQTRSFVFTLTGANVGLLDEMDFVNEPSSGGSPSMGGQFMGVRFRGFTIGAGSDKVPAHPVPSPIPEPGTLFLLGSGFLGVGALGWLRRRSS